MGFSHFLGAEGLYGLGGVFSRLVVGCLPGKGGGGVLGVFFKVKLRFVDGILWVVF